MVISNSQLSRENDAMVSSTPKVSVVMSVYNSAQYLPAAVESILAQTFTDFEFLIADDGSTDISLTILKNYAEQDNRILVKSQKNQGLTRTLNTLIQQARGIFIARMDADDIALSDRFTHQVELLENNPEVLCVGGAYDMIDGRGKVLLHIPAPTQDTEIQAQLLSGQTVIQHPCAMVRRSALEQVGGYDETLKTAQDLDLWLRIGEIGKLANLEQTVLQYRVHEQSVSTRRLKQQSRNARLACERAWKRRGLQGQPNCENAEARYQQLMLYGGWCAFNAGQRQDAISYGLRALKALPFNIESWRLLVCAVIKPLPGEKLE